MQQRPLFFWMCALVFGFSCIHPAKAQVTPQEEYMKRLKVAQTVQPLGETPFGESINLYSGEVSFRVVDAVLEGNGPSITLARNIGTSQEVPLVVYQPTNMGGWVLSIPRIEALAGGPSSGPSEVTSPGLLWKVSGTSPYARCTKFNRPLGNPAVNAQWWNGVTLYSGAGEGQQVLKRVAQNPAQPAMNDATGNPIVFPAVTQQHWQVGCLPNTSNGQTGEAFLVVAPDGTRYFMDRLHGYRAETVLEDLLDGSVEQQHRMVAVMYASRVEDRFGNYVNYNFTGDKLTSITSSDGRAVNIEWRTDAPLISRIIVQPADANPRIWQYEYVQPALGYLRLSAVVLPDNSRWTYTVMPSLGLGVGNMGLDTPYRDIYPDCGTRSLFDGPEVVSIDITHPSGLHGRFWTRPMWHARSFVPSFCVTPEYSQEFEPYEAETPIYGTNTLTKKELSGPGIATSLWQYRYNVATGSTTSDPCAAAGTCPTTVWTDVVDPAGNRTRYVHNNRWGEMEGKLLSVESFQGESTLLSSQTSTYATSTEGPYPSKLGDSMVYGGNDLKANTLTPVKKQVTVQQGRTFTWQVDSACAVGTTTLCFDARARPTQISKSSAPAP